MRLITTALLLLISGIHAYAQKEIRLSGTITNRQSDSVQVTFSTSRLAWYPKEYYGRLDKNGTFSMVISVPDDTYIQAELKHGRRLSELLLHEGDDLHMTADGKRLDSTLHYDGKGAAVQNFVTAHILARGRMNQYTMRMKSHIGKETEDFAAAVKKEEQTELDFLAKYPVKLPAPFTQYWTAFYQYYTYFFMQQYPQMHEVMKRRRYTDTVATAAYAAIADKVPVAFHDSLLQVPPYLLYLTGVMNLKLRAAGYNFPSADTAGTAALADSTVVLAYKKMPPRSAEYFIAQDIYGRAKQQPLHRTQRMFNDFKKRWPNSEYMPLLQHQVEFAERLAVGQPAPDFMIKTQDGKRMRLSDLKGKVVYLSFWSSSCRQCIGEMLSEKRVKDVMREKPVEFVHVQLDADTAVARMVKEKYHVTGTFTQAPAGWNSEEAQLYGVTGLPAYFLIDQEGKIAAQNVPSPVHRVELIVAIQKLF